MSGSKSEQRTARTAETSNSAKQQLPATTAESVEHKSTNTADGKRSGQVADADVSVVNDVGIQKKRRRLVKMSSLATSVRTLSASDAEAELTKLCASFHQPAVEPVPSTQTLRSMLPLLHLTADPTPFMQYIPSLLCLSLSTYPLVESTLLSSRLSNFSPTVLRTMQQLSWREIVQMRKDGEDDPIDTIVAYVLHQLNEATPDTIVPLMQASLSLLHSIPIMSSTSTSEAAMHSRQTHRESIVDTFYARLNEFEEVSADLRLSILEVQLESVSSSFSSLQLWIDDSFDVTKLLLLVAALGKKERVANDRLLSGMQDEAWKLLSDSILDTPTHAVDSITKHAMEITFQAQASVSNESHSSSSVSSTLIRGFLNLSRLLLLHAEDHSTLAETFIPSLSLMCDSEARSSLHFVCASISLAQVPPPTCVPTDVIGDSDVSPACIELSSRLLLQMISESPHEDEMQQTKLALLNGFVEAASSASLLNLCPIAVHRFTYLFAHEAKNDAFRDRLNAVMQNASVLVPVNLMIAAQLLCAAPYSASFDILVSHAATLTQANFVKERHNAFTIFDACSTSMALDRFLNASQRQQAAKLSQSLLESLRLCSEREDIQPGAAPSAAAASSLSTSISSSPNARLEKYKAAFYSSDDTPLSFLFGELPSAATPSRMIDVHQFFQTLSKQNNQQSWEAVLEQCDSTLNWTLCHLISTVAHSSVFSNSPTELLSSSLSSFLQRGFNLPTSLKTFPAKNEVHESFIAGWSALLAFSISVTMLNSCGSFITQEIDRRQAQPLASPPSHFLQCVIERFHFILQLTDFILPCLQRLRAQSPNTPECAKWLENFVTALELAPKVHPQILTQLFVLVLEDGTSQGPLTMTNAMDPVSLTSSDRCNPSPISTWKSLYEIAIRQGDVNQVTATVGLWSRINLAQSIASTLIHIVNEKGTFPGLLQSEQQVSMSIAWPTQAVHDANARIPSFLGNIRNITNELISSSSSVKALIRGLVTCRWLEDSLRSSIIGGVLDPLQKIDEESTTIAPRTPSSKLARSNSTAIGEMSAAAADIATIHSPAVKRKPKPSASPPASGANATTPLKASAAITAASPAPATPSTKQASATASSSSATSLPSNLLSFHPPASSLDIDSTVRLRYTAAKKMDELSSSISLLAFMHHTLFINTITTNNSDEFENAALECLPPAASLSPSKEERLRILLNYFALHVTSSDDALTALQAFEVLLLLSRTFPSDAKWKEGVCNWTSGEIGSFAFACFFCPYSNRLQLQCLTNILSFLPLRRLEDSVIGSLLDLPPNEKRYVELQAIFDEVCKELTVACQADTVYDNDSGMVGYFPLQLVWITFSQCSRLQGFERIEFLMSVLFELKPSSTSSAHPTVRGIEKAATPLMFQALALLLQAALCQAILVEPSNHSPEDESDDSDPSLSLFSVLKLHSHFLRLYFHLNKLQPTVSLAVSFRKHLKRVLEIMPFIVQQVTDEEFAPTDHSAAEDDRKEEQKKSHAKLSPVFVSTFQSLFRYSRELQEVLKLLSASAPAANGASSSPSANVNVGVGLNTLRSSLNHLKVHSLQQSFDGYQLKSHPAFKQMETCKLEPKINANTWTSKSTPDHTSPLPLTPLQPPSAPSLLLVMEQVAPVHCARLKTFNSKPGARTLASPSSSQPNSGSSNRSGASQRIRPGDVALLFASPQGSGSKRPHPLSGSLAASTSSAVHIEQSPLKKQKLSAKKKLDMNMVIDNAEL